MVKVTLLVGESADRRRLQLTLRLTAQGRIDDAPQREGEPPWLANWTTGDGAEHVGELIAVEKGWAVREQPGDDAPLLRLDARVLRPGEAVTLREADGTPTEFRVVAVEQD